ncbi:RNA polymerase sigma factor [Actinoplanes sp. TBRC 11911]|uniref:RNA polymerase sigma factor n=1 Tax=Actinoplanes sp. TBRC 11911 TaxID=2729386 RepID=UPI00145EB86D|nr:RNA polymerase sigma factor [Actinoplanes sp. TBRC 11911]NMO51476.1 RNA polymerase sigma factor [Actinoplanes sp. TBRC 11911]
MQPVDTEIVRAAQQGDRPSFALLYEMHYAGMLAVATSILGAVPEAEDACQDAAITALSRIGELRDPAALRSWLHAIVRNNCRRALGARTPVPVGVAGENLLADDLDDPIVRIENSAMRDWIWHALGQLTPAVQPVAMLRYFSGNNSYEHIAQLCGIPVGTVRSRLSEARRQLAEILPRVRDDRHDDVAARTTERREEAIAILSAAASGMPSGRIVDRWHKDVAMFWPEGVQTVGLESIFEVMARDHRDGVTYRLNAVTAGPGITVWEMGFVNPPHDPHHCPPGATWLLSDKKGRVRQTRLFRTPRPALG